ncbi:hypothetical protein SISNIDRAFT_483033 [Sistotremastrum niveocremeum HHB9708]|uniref:Mitochondrial DNA polymerase catalytic subunit n=1 Tax=Sistotremastrum niveocremeum HHB9708 TaxID=1314777 RepID=A0A164Y0Y7_9AGAM|nr:hypothetical protein SISNIDRAFT_483033 [Sistotremastrum niveocremeum HHB9708]
MASHFLAVRNEVGVQLLSRHLHKQIFKNISFPPPDPHYVTIAQQHLKKHGLDIRQGSRLPDISFDLPPLQGRTLDEHFWNVGAESAQPWLGKAKNFAEAQIPPQPTAEQWDISTSGWTKYEAGGISYPVPYPDESDDMLVFDVETLPNYSPFAIMATAASTSAWYAWISPWLLGQSSTPKHLIPFGPSHRPGSERIVVGHNVSYDRARIREEYHIQRTTTRYIDTMALHVAVKGISSGQRPSWIKYNKAKKAKADQEKKEDREEVEVLLKMVEDVGTKLAGETDEENRKRLEGEIDHLLKEIRAQEKRDAEEAARISADLEGMAENAGDENSGGAEKRWEDLTSANSLADVAKLHCGIEIDKTVRNDLMTHSPSQILDDIRTYLSYCATDVSTTHAVFTRVLPAFLTACPNPVSFAGVLTMGSSFLSVNGTWKEYLKAAENKFRELEESVKDALKELAEVARQRMEDESWKDDVWLSQLDWSEKVPGKSRGVDKVSKSPKGKKRKSDDWSSESTIPRWYRDLLKSGPFTTTHMQRTIPLLLNLRTEGRPVVYSTDHGWHCRETLDVDARIIPLPRRTKSKAKVHKIFSASVGPLMAAAGLGKLYDRLLEGNTIEEDAAVRSEIMRLAEKAVQRWKVEGPEAIATDPWLSGLDWSPMEADSDQRLQSSNDLEAHTEAEPSHIKTTIWPKWYWELAKPRKDAPPGSIDVTVRNRIAPLLLQLKWRGYPLFHSREYGWIFRVPSSDETFHTTTRQRELSFYEDADLHLRDAVLSGEFKFYKVPHKDGEDANVGSPLAKPFMKYLQDGTLTSPSSVAKEALDMNAQCSYWISARDRVLNQMVVWDREDVDMGIGSSTNDSWGMIVPQLITMGTVTRRAIEKTWLTASNAKSNRVGSELKAMVRAPPGYAIVGADVDSEELWISSVMGDAQFGLHGATAIGWMTLEGTKAAKTDLHSKTADILGITRDAAKVFNYSRIYGAGMRHAQLLLLQNSASMVPEKAKKLAEDLYAATKGKNTHRPDLFGRKFWFGGSESFVFNKLEEIALSDRPQTPALGCGVTYALSKEYLPNEFGSDYMPSRINWVVQSSGVDYLHLLIVAMEHLILRYGIQARYLISVHDELRFLVKEEDKYRAALALQIANLWTRSQFAYRLGMDDLPQGVAFFSAVDVDTILRKEVFMTCETPSHQHKLEPGESLDIQQILEKTDGGKLGDVVITSPTVATDVAPEIQPYIEPDCLVHRAPGPEFLQAQATDQFNEIKALAEELLVDSILTPAAIGAKATPRKRGQTSARRIKLGKEPVPNDTDFATAGTDLWTT